MQIQLGARGDAKIFCTLSTLGFLKVSPSYVPVTRNVLQWTDNEYNRLGVLTQNVSII